MLVCYVCLSDERGKSGHRSQWIIFVRVKLRVFYGLKYGLRSSLGHYAYVEFISYHLSSFFNLSLLLRQRPDEQKTKY